MPTLLIIIVAGFVLLSLGSPDKVEQSITHARQLIQQLPEKAASKPQHQTTDNKPDNRVEPVDFAHVGEQEDIPVSEVLNAPITPASEIIPVAKAPESMPVGHRDNHTFEDIHTVNAEALEILDRIANTYQ